MDAGVPVAGRAISPVVPSNLASCVTQTFTAGRTVGRVLGPSQEISAQEALVIYTTRSAHATGEASVKGRLCVGNLLRGTACSGEALADFVVLSDAPLAVDPKPYRAFTLTKPVSAGGRPGATRRIGRDSRNDDQDCETTNIEPSIRTGARRTGLIGGSMGTFLSPTPRRFPR
nr:amidohydrolase family protein [Saccharopolyspora sp. ASAGF58]